MALYRTFECQTSFESISISVQQKKLKINFQDGDCGTHLQFLIGTILAIFALQINLILPVKFPVKWPWVSGVEVRNRFARWKPSWTSDRNDI